MFFGSNVKGNKTTDPEPKKEFKGQEHYETHTSLKDKKAGKYCQVSTSDTLGLLTKRLLGLKRMV